MSALHEEVSLTLDLLEAIKLMLNLSKLHVMYENEGEI